MTKFTERTFTAELIPTGTRNKINVALVLFFHYVYLRIKSLATVEGSEVAESDDEIGDDEWEGSNSEVSHSLAKRKKNSSEEDHFKEPAAAVYSCENKWCRDFQKVFKYASLKERHERL